MPGEDEAVDRLGLKKQSIGSNPDPLEVGRTEEGSVQLESTTGMAAAPVIGLVT
jgi:hypothetical protein